MIRWGAPHYLQWFWLLPLVAALLLAGLRRRRERLERLVASSLLPDLAPAWDPARERRRLVARIAALAFGLLALARPQWGFRWEEVRRQSLDIVVALDTSRSMLANDFKPNRLQQARWGLRDLVRKLRGDRIALVVFAGDALLECPLTHDYDAFLMILNDVYAGVVPRGGTAIERAIRRSLDVFDEREADRVLLLVTDGEDHEGDPRRTLGELRERGVRVMAIGVGTPEGELIPLPPEEKQAGFVRDAGGLVVKSTLREEVLRELAGATGGLYVRADRTDFGVERIVRQGLSGLRREEEPEARMVKAPEERFAWPLAAALFCLLLEAWPGRRRPAGRTAAPAACLLALLVVLPARANPPEKPSESRAARRQMETGLRAYHDQHYEEAAEAFRKAAETAGGALDPADAHYNLGQALFRLGDFPAAAEAFGRALHTGALARQADALYNRGNTLAESARQALKEGQPGQAAEQVRGALDDYRQSLLLAPDGRDAKVNYELARRLQEDIEEILRQQPPQKGEDKAPPQDREPEGEQGDRGDPGDPDPAEGDEEPEPDEASPPGEEDEQAGAPAAENIEEQTASEGLTDEEARLLLDALKEEEEAERRRLRVIRGRPEPADRDW